MSFQAYLDNVKAKTGKSPAEFAHLATQKGLTKHGEIVAWLKSTFELGHGHATAVAGVILKGSRPPRSDANKLDDLFSGTKVSWRKPCDSLITKIMKWGPDVEATANSSYVNLLRAKRKFGILQPASASRLDVGIKLKGQAPAGRFEPAGDWHAMVTHRVRIDDAEEIDAELRSWLRNAYRAA